MKAAQLTDYGQENTISINEVPTPQPKEEQLLVEVHAAGVNPFDWKVQLGWMKDYIPLALPATLGSDFAGVVKESKSPKFKPGDEVYGQAGLETGGSFAQFVIANPQKTALKPKKLDFIHAGALPLAGVSALQALTVHIKLAKGQKILIQGGAGGIGSMAIQIAKYLGAFVAATVSTSDIDYVKKLGADLVIDYKNQNFEEEVSGFDAVFDTVGGETTNKSLNVIKPGGILVSMVSQADEEIAKAKNITGITQGTNITSALLEKLSELAQIGAVTVNVEKTFPLEEAANALAYLHNTPPKGKVVLKI